MVVPTESSRSVLQSRAENGSTPATHGAYMPKGALTLVNHYASVLLEELDKGSSCSIISTRQIKETQSKERAHDYSRRSQTP